VITVTSADATEVSLVATIDSAPYILGTPFADNGAHVFEVTATDAAGNTASEVRNFTIDTDPPLVDDLFPAPGTVHAQLAIDVAGRVDDDAVEVTVGGALAIFGGSGTNWIGWTAHDVPLDQEGPNSLPLRAVDAAGNLTELDLTYIRDTVGPEITLSAPEEGLITRFTSLTVSGVATDAHLELVTVNGSEVAVGAAGSFSHTVTLVRGNNTITVVARDAVSQETTAVRSVVLDTTPPVLSVTDSGVPLVDGFKKGAPVIPLIDAVDDTAVTIEITLNSQPFSSGTSISGEGSYLLAVTATDAAGNVANLERSFSIDLTPPVLSGLSLADGVAIAETSPLLTGACDDAVAVTVNGQPASLTAGTFSYSGLTFAEGANTITVTAADDVGNEATVALTVVLDTTGPSLSVSSPVDGALLSEASLTVVGTAQDPHLERVTVAGREAALAGSSFQARAPLAQEGANVITIVAVDRAGNSSELVLTVERDTTAPALTVDEPGPSAILGSATVTVSGSVADAHGVSLAVATRGVTPAADGSFSADLQFPEGAHSLEVVATDEVGNRSTIRREISVDLSAPELRIAAPSAGAVLPEAMVTVSGKVDDPFGTDRVTINGQPAQLDENGDFELVGLILKEGANTIIARAWDAAGNTGTRSIEISVDTAPPSVLATVPADGATSVPTSARPRVRFSEPVDATSLTGHIRLSKEGNLLEIDLALIGEGDEVDVAPVGDLADNAEHLLEVDAAVTDRAGHPLDTSVSAAFTTVDSTPPQPPILDSVASPACFEDLTLTGVAEGGATVFVTGDVHPTSTTAAGDGAFTIVLEPAIGEGAIEIEAAAEDAAGNRSRPAYLVVELDCTPPQVTASEWDGETTITIRWSEELDESTVTVGGSVLVDGSVSPLAYTATTDGGTITISLAAAAPIEELPLRLELTTGITDLAGNPARPYSQLFTDPGRCPRCPRGGRGAGWRRSARRDGRRARPLPDAGHLVAGRGPGRDGRLPADLAPGGADSGCRHPALRHSSQRTRRSGGG
jgi:hypothetical protein